MNNSLAYLKKCAGTAARLRTIFNYHYDQILRECEQEIFCHGLDLKDPEAHNLHDCLVEFMEERMAWPDPEDQDSFDREIAGERASIEYDKMMLKD